MALKRIAVFCGFNTGSEPEYMQAAQAMGNALAKREITLVYGGGRMGMQGALSRAVLEAGGRVIGVMPKSLVEKDMAFDQLTDLRVAKDLPEHKAMMAELAGGFIALPGGLGTLEEFFEILTWAQIGLHHKPCGLLNVNGYFDKLLAFIDHVRDMQFISQPARDLLITAENPDKILELFMEFASKKTNHSINL